MQPVLVTALMSAVVAAVVTSLFVPPVIWLARTVGALDHPGGRRQHTSSVPRLGGIAMAVGLAFALSSMGLVGRMQRQLTVDKLELAALAMGTIFVFCLGVADDLFKVSVTKKLVVEVVAAWLLVAAGWSFERISLPWGGQIELGPFGVVLTIVWVVGVTNAINFIDGLDGLAAGVVGLISASFMVYSAMLGDYLNLIVSGAMLGACLGFLRHNWRPAKIFMGDSGSLMLGFLLGGLSLHSATKAPAAVAILVPVLALGVPVQDTLLVMALRFFGRPEGKTPRRLLHIFRADRSHLHHVMQNLNLNRHRVVIIVYGLVVMFCAFSLMVAVARRTDLGLVLVVVEFAVILGIRRLGLDQEARRAAALGPTEVEKASVE